MHCGKALYNNLLWKNWSKQCLPLIKIIGNSFDNIKQRFVQVMNWWNFIRMPAGRWHFLGVFHTGHSRDISNETTVILLRLCVCAKRGSFPVRPTWMASSTTQQSSLLKPMCLTVSHNPPGKIHLNQSTNIALNWRLFSEKIKKNRAKEWHYWMFLWCHRPKQVSKEKTSGRIFLWQQNASRKGNVFLYEMEMNLQRLIISCFFYILHDFLGVFSLMLFSSSDLCGIWKWLVTERWLPTNATPFTWCFTNYKCCCQFFFISTFYIVLWFSNKMKSMSQKKYSMEFTSATDHNPLPSTQLTNWNKILKLPCGLLDSTAISILQQWHQQHRVRNLRIFQF